MKNLILSFLFLIPVFFSNTILAESQKAQAYLYSFQQHNLQELSKSLKEQSQLLGNFSEEDLDFSVALDFPNHLNGVFSARTNFLSNYEDNKFQLKYDFDLDAESDHNPIKVSSEGQFRFLESKIYFLLEQFDTNFPLEYSPNQLENMDELNQDLEKLKHKWVFFDLTQILGDLTPEFLHELKSLNPVDSNQKLLKALDVFVQDFRFLQTTTDTLVSKDGYYEIPVEITDQALRDMIENLEEAFQNLNSPNKGAYPYQNLREMMERDSNFINQFHFTGTLKVKSNDRSIWNLSGAFDNGFLLAIDHTLDGLRIEASEGSESALLEYKKNTSLEIKINNDLLMEVKKIDDIWKGRIFDEKKEMEASPVVATFWWKNKLENDKYYFSGAFKTNLGKNESMELTFFDSNIASNGLSANINLGMTMSLQGLEKPAKMNFGYKYNYKKLNSVNVKAPLKSSDIETLKNENKVLQVIFDEFLKPKNLDYKVITNDLEPTEKNLQPLLPVIEQEKKSKKLQKTKFKYPPRNFHSKPLIPKATMPSSSTVILDGTDPIVGRGKLMVVEYVDFACPFCRRAHNQNKAYFKSLTDQDLITYVVKDFPLDFHGEAVQKAHIATNQILNELGDYDAFMFIDLVFDRMDEWVHLDGLAAEQYFANLSVEFFDFEVGAWDNPNYKQEIEQDKREGLGKGVSGTPTFFIGDQVINGAVPLSQLKKVIESHLSN